MSTTQQNNGYVPRLKEQYQTKLRSQLQKDLGLDNIMEVPKVSKVVINVGVKEAVSDSRIMTIVTNVLEAIAGQKPVKTAARKSIAGFKIREGMIIGARVTLRGQAMYTFLDKFISVALPKVRDFQGVPTRFDGRGGYNVGIKEWNIFPEAEKAGAMDKSYGLNITIDTTAQSDEHALALLKAMGMPFKK